ncbi:antibiotic biosynthesis monooxygenase family protein [Metabacillus litoralis]|uniref:antibiotic biosynthesis monooxygenase family protein n=1 Tax=Metabacillus litoralis TaxID=152268 RepID=UPI00203EFAF1|nr:antibiotic biosynthesis monooxygenase [Metabacillus litoralis]MCM3409958.1 antibiotic biosynthesis monooxygenase [Metabacillus litoralis]
MLFAKTPPPPYYAVIFTSLRLDSEGKNYSITAEQMVKLASKQDGFLGVESSRDLNVFGITVSYWNSLEAIKEWRENSLHRIAQDKGRTNWYLQYNTRICKVDREYSFCR